MNKKDNKKTIIIIVAVILIIAAIVVAALLIKGKPAKTDDNANKEVDESISADVNFEGLKFTDTKIYAEGDNYIFTMNVTNQTQETINIPDVDIKLYDKNDTPIAALIGHIGDTIEPGDKRMVTSLVPKDVADITKAVRKTIEKHVQVDLNF